MPAYALVHRVDAPEYQVLINGPEIGDGSMPAAELRAMVTVDRKGWYELFDDDTAAYVGDELPDDDVDESGPNRQPAGPQPVDIVYSTAEPRPGETSGLDLMVEEIIWQACLPGADPLQVTDAIRWIADDDVRNQARAHAWAGELPQAQAILADTFDIRLPDR